MDTKIKELINKSNILLEILDARFPKLCRIKYIEKYIKNKNKDLILVLNKSDLVSEDFLKKVIEEFSKEYITVYMSAIYRKGSRKLREAIKKVGKKI
jgi:Predicted GTPases